MLRAYCLVATLLAAASPSLAGQLECETLKKRDEQIALHALQSFRPVEAATLALKDQVNEALTDPSIPTETLTKLRQAIFGEAIAAIESGIKQGRADAYDGPPADPAYDALLADACGN